MSELQAERMIILLDLIFNWVGFIIGHERVICRLGVIRDNWSTIGSYWHRHCYINTYAGISQISLSIGLHAAEVL